MTKIKYLALNQSRITDFMMCPKFYELRHIDRLDRGAKALRIGKMTHQLLEQFTKLREEGLDHEPVQPEGSDEVEWEMATRLYWAYRRVYGEEKLSIIMPEVEAHARFATIKTPQANWEVHIIATLDGVVDYQGGKYLAEYKTAANLGAAQFDRFLNDYQLTTYMWIALRALELKLDGAVCTILPKTKDPQPARIVVTRTAFQFTEWEKTTLYEARNIIQCMEANHFPQRQSNCTKWNRACIFHQFCMTGERCNLVDMETRKHDYADNLRKELTNAPV